MQIETGQKLAFFYGTQVPVEFSAETAFPAGVYTFAVKQHRDPAEAAIALSTVTLAEAATTLSAALDFGTEKALAVSQTGDFEVWLEISTAGKVFFQQEAEFLPRVYDGSTPAPTPVTLYYTKAEVDALIAGISGAVDSVNGQTGAVVLDAEDVGAVAIPVREALTSTTFAPAPLSIYSHTVVAGDVLDFGTPANSVPVVFKLDLTVPDGAPSFSFAQTITWEGGSAPDFSAAGVYPLYFEYDGGWRGWRRPDMSEYLPLSGGTVTGRLDVRGGLKTGLVDAGVALCGGTAATGMFAVMGRAAQTVAVAIGYESNCSYKRGAALGRGTYVTADDSVATGVFNSGAADSTIALVVGCGTANNNRKDGLIVRKDGAGTDILGDVKVATSGGTISVVDLAQRIAALEAAQA